MQDISTVYKAYLELVKIGIGTSKNDFDFSSLSDDDWNAVFRESKKQTTALLCFDALKNVSSKPSKEIYDAWFVKATKVLSYNFLVLREQRELVRILNENNLPYVILKGWSSAGYYPNNELRCYGDIDFLVDGNNVESTKQLLIDSNYSLADETSKIHYEYFKNKARIELHKVVSGIPENSFGECFKRELDSVINDSVMVDGMIRPTDYHHGIIIFLHTIHHMFHNGVGMRHLSDWACFVKNTHTKDFWQEKFIPLLKETGTFKFMCGLTLTAEKLLGINRPAWCMDVDPDMVNTMILEICGSGNFGNKRTNVVSMLMVSQERQNTSAVSKIKIMLKKLNDTNHIVCPAIKKAPILYPFVMIYRVVRYLVLMCLGKRPSFDKMSRYADERNSVFIKYELYKVEDEK